MSQENQQVILYNLFKKWYKFQAEENGRQFNFENEDYSREFNKLCKDNHISSNVTSNDLYNFYISMNFANEYLNN